MDHRWVRTVFEDYVPRDASPGDRVQGTYKFVERFREKLGLGFNKFNRPAFVGEAEVDYRQFNLRALADTLCPGLPERLYEDYSRTMRVMEAGGNPAAVVPGDIPDVSAYLGSVIGLLDAAMLTGYDTPEFMIDDLVPTVPAKTRQSSFIGFGRIGDKSARRNPGEGHEWARFDDRVVKTPETLNDALAGAVTKEAVFFDQTNSVLQQMEEIGRELALRKELDGFRVLAGVTGATGYNGIYEYNGTLYNTYLTSGNWINDFENELNDWTDVDYVEQQFAKMTDQETGNRISVDFDTILVSRAKKNTALQIKAATEIETITAGGQELRRGASKVGSAYNIVSSVYWDQVLTDTANEYSKGLGLSTANAAQYWLAVKTTPNRSAFVRTENFPMKVERATGNSMEMLDKGIVLAVFADQMHRFGVMEPRYVIRCKNES